MEVGVANSTSLGYLDLTVNEELREQATPEYLDLASAVPKFESLFVIVSSGERLLMAKL